MRDVVAAENPAAWGFIQMETSAAERFSAPREQARVLLTERHRKPAPGHPLLLHGQEAMAVVGEAASGEAPDGVRRLARGRAA
jgi:hypothetical protein